MIPFTFLCDEYVDRPKLTEQKNPFEYIVPPPDKWGRNNDEIGSKSTSNKILWRCIKLVKVVQCISSNN